MKIHLILVYHHQGQNVWADVEAYTSPRERDKAMQDRQGDFEAIDTEVLKRAYNKTSPVPLSDVEPAHVFRTEKIS